MPQPTPFAPGSGFSEHVGFWPRAASYTIDSLLLTVALFVGFLVLLGLVAGTSKAGMPGLGIFLAVLLGLVMVAGTWAYFALSWLSSGATYGQRWMGQQVDADTYGPLQPWQAWVRVLGYAISGMFWYLGFLWVAFEPRKRGWHDLIARTVVIPA